MQKAIGVILIIGGLVLGVYLGLWVCFIGGIVQFITGCKADPINALDLAIGIARVFAAGFVGWFSGIVTMSIGVALLE